MKREGRQHGMVRTYPILPSPLNPKPEPRYINKTSSPPTAGLFTKVSSKPNNHSKFTGKCGRPRCNSCHIHPASKSKDKTKGSQKLKLISWRVIDSRPGGKFSGLSATGLLDHLDSDYDDGYHYDYDNNDEEIIGEELIVDSSGVLTRGVEIEEISGYEDNKDDYNDVDDEGMSFCEVGFVWENVEEEYGDWCVVEEM